MSLFLLSLLACTRGRLNVVPYSTDGTEHTQGLTDKQLAIQRQFAYWTFLNPDGPYNFTANSGWRQGDQDISFLDGYRFEMGFLTMGVAAMQYQTPAYREVASALLRNLVDRMLQPVVWEYWGADPVAHANVYYSGYLSQVIALYESLTGDLETYGVQGFDFPPYPTHYNTSSLNQLLREQALSFPGIGGITCEKNSIFMGCQGPPQQGLRLNDAVRGTDNSDIRHEWYQFLTQNATGCALDPNHTLTWRNFFEVGGPYPGWTEPGMLGIPFSDAWIDLFLYTFVDADSDGASFAYNAWRLLNKNPGWTQMPDGTVKLNFTGTYTHLDPLVCPREKYCEDILGSSTYTVVEAQNALSNDSSVLLNPQIYLRHELHYGAPFDTDGDGYNDGYYYYGNASLPLYGLPHFWGDQWVTGNLFHGMMLDQAFAHQMYQEAFYTQVAGQPYLQHVDFPTVVVPSAIYAQETGILNFSLAINAPVDTYVSDFVVDSAGGKILSVLVDGSAYTSYSVEAGSGLVTFSSFSINNRSSVQIYFALESLHYEAHPQQQAKK